MKKTEHHRLETTKLINLGEAIQDVQQRRSSFNFKERVRRKWPLNAYTLGSSASITIIIREHQRTPQ